MCVSLHDYQVKASRYRNVLTYLKNRATTNQNQNIYSQKAKKKRTQAQNKGNNSTKKKKITKEKHRINWTTRFKMTINTYLSIIALMSIN